MRVGLRADSVVGQSVDGRIVDSFIWLTSGQHVRSRPADANLDDLGDNAGDGEAHEEACNNERMKMISICFHFMGFRSSKRHSCIKRREKVGITSGQPFASRLVTVVGTALLEPCSYRRRRSDSMTRRKEDRVPLHHEFSHITDQRPKKGPHPDPLTHRLSHPLRVFTLRRLDVPQTRCITPLYIPVRGPCPRYGTTIIHSARPDVLPLCFPSESE